MYQIDVDTASQTLPAATPLGTVGYFTDGDLLAGKRPTVVPAEFFNAIMIELLNVVVAAGLTPTKTHNDQVATAIEALIATSAANVLAQLGALAKLNIGTGLLNDGHGNLAVNASSTAGKVASVLGVITPGHIATFADPSGTIQDGGLPGVSVASVYINTSTTIGPGNYDVDTSAGPITLTLIASPTLGTKINLNDALNTWGINNVTVVGGSNTIVGSASNFICDISGVDVPFLFKSGDWKIS